MAKIGSIRAEQDHRLFLAGRRLGEALREHDLTDALQAIREAERAPLVRLIGEMRVEEERLRRIIQKQTELLNASDHREER